MNICEPDCGPGVTYLGDDGDAPDLWNERLMERGDLLCASVEDVDEFDDDDFDDEFDDDFEEEWDDDLEAEDDEFADVDEDADFFGEEE